MQKIPQKMLHSDTIAISILLYNTKIRNSPVYSRKKKQLLYPQEVTSQMDSVNIKLFEMNGVARHQDR
jgi:hypothetical protein